MAAYALLIGTQGDKRTLLLDGSPVDVRKTFKTSDGEGFETLEVIETGVGRSRSRKFVNKQAKKQANKQSKTTKK